MKLTVNWGFVQKVVVLHHAWSWWLQHPYYISKLWFDLTHFPNLHLAVCKTLCGLLESSESSDTTCEIKGGLKSLSFSRVGAFTDSVTPSQLLSLKNVYSSQSSWAKKVKQEWIQFPLSAVPYSIVSGALESWFNSTKPENSSIGACIWGLLFVYDVTSFPWF